MQVRPRNSPWVSITTADSPTLVLRVGSSDKTLSGSLQSRQYSYTVYDHEQRQDVTRSRDANVLEFSYTVQKGDRDTDGVSVAANALAGGNVGGSSFGGGTWYPNLSKYHSAMSAQSGHKVDTPAPTWSGVTAPAVLFYTGATVNYRLPQVANAASAHNVSYSVTSARPLPTGYSLNASTATITGSYGSALARQNYTLRATEGFHRTADLVFTLEVSADVGIESISITSNPGADKTYGKVAPFGTNDTITVRVDFTGRLSWVNPSVCLDIRIGGHTRQACSFTYDSNNAAVWDKVDFSYAVQTSDWDGDGISFPASWRGRRRRRIRRWRRFGSWTGRWWWSRSQARREPCWWRPRRPTPTASRRPSASRCRWTSTGRPAAAGATLCRSNKARRSNKACCAGFGRGHRRFRATHAPTPQSQRGAENQTPTLRWPWLIPFMRWQGATAARYASRNLIG